MEKMHNRDDSNIQWLVAIFGLIILGANIILIIEISLGKIQSYNTIKIIAGFTVSIGIILQSIRSWLGRGLATLFFTLALSLIIIEIFQSHFYKIKIEEIVLIIVNIYLILDNLKDFKEVNWAPIIRYKYLVGIRSEDAIYRYFAWLFHKKRFNKIIKTGKKFIDNSDIQFYLGASHIFLEKYKEGKWYLKKIESHKKYKNVIKYYLGLIDYNQKRYSEAIYKITEYLNENPKDYNALELRAFSNTQLGKYNEAILDYTTILESNQNLSTVLYNRGLCKYDIREIEEAEIDWLEAINQRRPIEEAFIKLAEIMVKKNEINQAIIYYKRAIKINKSLNKNLSVIIDNLKYTRNKKLT